MGFLRKELLANEIFLIDGKQVLNLSLSFAWSISMIREKIKKSK